MVKYLSLLALQRSSSLLQTIRPLNFTLLLGFTVLVSTGCSFVGPDAHKEAVSQKASQSGLPSKPAVGSSQVPATPEPPAAKAAAPASPPHRCTVDVYGDSIMANNSTLERPLIALQRKHPALVFVDHSAPEVLLTTLAKSFNNSPRTGRWVVIENGVIDAWKKVQPAIFVQTLIAMIERVRSEGREPVLTGFSRQVAAPAFHIHAEQLKRRDHYDLLMRGLAETMKVPFVDWGSVRFDGAGDLQDGIHPGLTYSNRLFEKLGAKLVAMSGCK